MNKKTFFVVFKILKKTKIKHSLCKNINLAQASSTYITIRRENKEPLAAIMNVRFGKRKSASVSECHSRF